MNTHDKKCLPGSGVPLSRRIVLASGGSLLAYASALALGVGCSADTGSGRSHLTTRIEPVSSEPFTNAFGWTVRLEHAYLSIGSLAYFEGEALGFLRLLRALALPVAHAHPGHYEAGGAVGEMLGPVSVDLMAAATTLGVSRGVQEQARSARFTFGSPAAEPFQDELGDAVVRFEGQAASGDALVYFASSVLAADVTGASGGAEVEGCPFTGGELPETGTLTLRVDLGLWFDQVDFSDEDPGSKDEPTELPVEGRARRALVRGLAKTAAYQFGIEAEQS